MIVNVHMRDGRTVFQFASRNDLKVALDASLGQLSERRPREVARAWVKWHVESPGWVELRAPYLAAASIAFVVAAEDVADGKSVEGDLPAKALAEERAARWRIRAAEETPA